MPPEGDKQEEGIKPSCEVRPAGEDCPQLSLGHPDYPVKARGPQASSHPDAPPPTPQLTQTPRGPILLAKPLTNSMGVLGDGRAL